MRQWVRPALEIGPLLIFFLVNNKFGLMNGTLAFVVATAIALPLNWYLEKRLPVMPLVSGVFVLAFGGLTLLLDDSFFIKIKPTIVNSLFAFCLTLGLLLGRNFLKILFGSVFVLDDAGWRILTLRWIAFFIVLAILNEITWRFFSEDFWVSFKLFGALPLTLVFSFAQLPLIKRHWAGEKNPFA
jgi:intracellular septation protein